MRALTDSMIIGLFALRLLPGQMLRRVTESIFIVLLSLSILSGCSTQSAKTVETEKTVHYATETDPAQSEPVVTEKQTTKTEETTKSEGQSVGLLSGTVHVVGEVIALPFRAVAGLITLAF
jgi:sorbitol-specific phosphotransferase system component IIBC